MYPAVEIGLPLGRAYAGKTLHLCVLGACFDVRNKVKEARQAAPLLVMELSGLGHLTAGLDGRGHGVSAKCLPDERYADDGRQ